LGRLKHQDKFPGLACLAEMIAEIWLVHFTNNTINGLAWEDSWQAEVKSTVAPYLVFNSIEADLQPLSTHHGRDISVTLLSMGLRSNVSCLELQQVANSDTFPALSDCVLGWLLGVYLNENSEAGPQER
jgi:hypothetical protein